MIDGEVKSRPLTYFIIFCVSTFIFCVSTFTYFQIVMMTISMINTGFVLMGSHISLAMNGLVWGQCALMYATTIWLYVAPTLVVNCIVALFPDCRPLLARSHTHTHAHTHTRTHTHTHAHTHTHTHTHAHTRTHTHN
jgi:ABC-type nickel/cobalt efflux system permease component RcnA